MGLFPMLECYVSALLVCASSVYGQVRPPAGLNFSITEGLDPGTVIGNLPHEAGLRSEYMDTVYSSLRYTFLSKNVPHIDLLELDNTSGILKTAQNIDRETLCARQDVCAIKVDVLVKPRLYYKLIKVAIFILDLNDNPPVFPKPEVELHLPESTAQNTTFPLAPANDKDSPRNGIGGYQLIPGSDVFSLKTDKNLESPLPLQLILLKPLDRETKDTYDLNVVALDKGSPPKSGSVIVTVYIQDTNDNKPVFNSSLYMAQIGENAVVGTIVATVYARDADAGLNGEIQYKLQEPSPDKFAINKATGEIYTIASLDYETKSEYTLSVAAQDKGPFPLPTFTTVKIQVTDMNDHAPEIEVSTFSEALTAEVTENQPLRTVVAHVRVSDRDQGINGHVTCSLDNPIFALQDSYGSEYDIITTQQLDREHMAEYNVTLACRDGGKPQQSTQTGLKVKVIDLNDNRPFFRGQPYVHTFKENNEIGAVLMNVSAVDLDSGRNGMVRYRIEESFNKYVNIDSITGVIRASTDFDYELLKTLELRVLASDLGSPRSQSATATVTLIVQDTNDEAPKFDQTTYYFNVDENKAAGTEVGKVTAEDSDAAPYNQFQYSIDYNHANGHGHKFYVNPQTGLIRTRTLLDRESQYLYVITVLAIETNAPYRNSTTKVKVYIIDVNDNPPIIDFPNLFNSTVHVAHNVPPNYDFTRVMAHDDDSGENAKLSYSLPKSTDNGTFRINPRTGALSFVYVPIITTNQQKYTVRIFVSDNGSPTQSGYAELHVVLDSALQYTGPMPSSAKGGSGAFLSEDNMRIIIIVSGIFGLLIILLLVALICLKRKSHPPVNRDERMRGTSRVQVRLLEPISKIDADIRQAWTTPMDEFGKDNLFVCPQGGVTETEQETLYVPQQRRGSGSKQYTCFAVPPAPPPPRQPQMGVRRTTSYQMSTADSGRGLSLDGELDPLNPAGANCSDLPRQGKNTPSSSKMREKTLTVKPSPSSGYLMTSQNYDPRDYVGQHSSKDADRHSVSSDFSSCSCPECKPTQFQHRCDRYKPGALPHEASTSC